MAPGPNIVHYGDPIIWIDVMAPPYNAAADGVTDDTAAIQSAINSVAATGGGEVRLPAGTCRFTQIAIKTRVRLIGQGFASILKQVNSANVNAIVLATVNEEQTQLANFQLDGNKSGQSSGHGIYYDNTGFISALGQSTPRHFMSNLFVRNTKQDGIHITGDAFGGEGHYDHLQIHAADGIGFYMDTPDNWVSHISSGSSGLEGFYITGGNLRFVDCKSWFSGRIDPTRGDGYYLTGNRNNWSCCEAQDNQKHGFEITTSNSILLGLVADSNSSSGSGTPSGQSSNGFQLGNVQKSTFSGTAFDRFVPATQQFAIGFTGSTYIGSHFDLTVDGNAVGVQTGSPSGLGAATLNIDRQWASGAATGGTFTPNPQSAGIQTLGLTQNATINNPTAGLVRNACLRFIFTQDGIGGWSTSFGTAFKVNWSPNLSPGKINTITFQYDGTNWNQIASATGL